VIDSFSFFSALLLSAGGRDGGVPHDKVPPVAPSSAGEEPLVPRNTHVSPPFHGLAVLPTK